MALFRESIIKGSTFQYSVGVAKLSVEQGFVQLGTDYCPLYGVAGCPLFRGFKSIEVYGQTIRTFRIVRYIVGVRC